MDARQIKPAGQLMQRFGVKMVMFGGAGSGKTPTVNTAPRPLLLVVEPGLASMRGSTVPAFEAYTAQLVDEFFVWFFNSHEAKAYDTLAVDSISQMAEIILTQELARCKDGRMAYGEMSKRMMKHLNALFYMPQKHLALIGKQCNLEVGTKTVAENGVFRVEAVRQKRIFFPGNDLDTKVPHMFDEILHLDRIPIPGQGIQQAFRTREVPEIFARDRSGNLAEYEPANLDYIFKKCMAA